MTDQPDYLKHGIETAQAIGRVIAEQPLLNPEALAAGRLNEREYPLGEPGGHFRQTLKRIVEEYDESLGNLISNYPSVWAELVGSFYVEYPSEVASALEVDDLKQIAAQLLSDSDSELAGVALMEIGRIVSKAALAYIGEDIAKIYRITLDAHRVMKA